MWAGIILVACVALCVMLLLRQQRDRPVDLTAPPFVIESFDENPELKFGVKRESRIPPRIWAFWDSSEVPVSVTKCMDTWRQHNPLYEIVLLRPNNLSRYIDEDVAAFRHNDSPARLSDFVRLSVLSKHGGIWMDASMICNAPIDWLHGIQVATGAELIAYYIPNFTTREDSKVIESWFIAAARDCRLVREWKAEFYRMNEFGTVGDYISDLRAQGVDLQKLATPEYLAIHAAVQKVMQKVPGLAGTAYLMDSNVGPYRYLVADWDSEAAIERLCEQPDLYATPLVKLRGQERTILEKDRYRSCKIFHALPTETVMPSKVSSTRSS